LLKLIKNDRTDVELMGFEGDKIENYLGDNQNFNLDGGLNVRLALWRLPLLTFGERVFGSESTLIIQDKDLCIFPSMPILNTKNLKLSSFLVGIESLSLELATNSKLNSGGFNKIQLDFYKEFFNDDSVQNIIDLNSASSSTFNSKIKKFEYVRIPATTLFISSEYLHLKNYNEKTFEFLPTNKIQLLELALLEAKQFIKFYEKTFEILNFSANSTRPKFINDFIKRYENTDFSLLSPSEPYNTLFQIPLKRVL
jgi:hypothetical protein